jgi:hypothetical protein
MSDLLIGIGLAALLFVLAGLLPHRGCTGHCAGCDGACGRFDQGDRHDAS